MGGFHQLSVILSSFFILVISSCGVSLSFERERETSRRYMCGFLRTVMD
jgi:hypothetical protein